MYARDFEKNGAGWLVDCGRTPRRIFGEQRAVRPLRHIDKKRSPKAKSLVSLNPDHIASQALS